LGTHTTNSSSSSSGWPDHALQSQALLQQLWLLLLLHEGCLWCRLAPARQQQRRPQQQLLLLLQERGS
jgi:hypothetical protein